MNARVGLQRVSAVFWGVPGALAVGLFAYLAFEGGLDSLGVLKLGAILAALFVAHRLTCWVVDGFFSRK